MTEGTIVDRVGRILTDEFELDGAPFSPGVSLYEDLGLDSLDSVDLVVALEKEFGFKVVRSADEATIRAIRTIGDLCGFVESKLKPGNDG